MLDVTIMSRISLQRACDMTSFSFTAKPEIFYIYFPPHSTPLTLL